jgi:hypothetical protein
LGSNASRGYLFPGCWSEEDRGLDQSGRPTSFWRGIGILSTHIALGIPNEVDPDDEDDSDDTDNPELLSDDDEKQLLAEMQELAALTTK